MTTPAPTTDSEQARYDHNDALAEQTTYRYDAGPVPTDGSGFDLDPPF